MSENNWIEAGSNTGDSWKPENEGDTLIGVLKYHLIGFQKTCNLSTLKIRDFMFGLMQS